MVYLEHSQKLAETQELADSVVARDTKLAEIAVAEENLKTSTKVGRARKRENAAILSLTQELDKLDKKIKVLSAPIVTPEEKTTTTFRTRGGDSNANVAAPSVTNETLADTIKARDLAKVTLDTAQKNFDTSKLVGGQRRAAISELKRLKSNLKDLNEQMDNAPTATTNTKDLANALRTRDLKQIEFETAKTSVESGNLRGRAQNKAKSKMKALAASLEELDNKIKALTIAPQVSTGTTPLKLATGGPVSGSGTGTSDSIPALLSNGEFVMNAKSSKMFRPVLEAMNARKFGKGGAVSDEEGYSQYLQFKGTGVGSFDMAATFKLFVAGLDQSNDKVKRVIYMMNKLANSSKNSNQQEILNEAYTRDINNTLNELVNPELKELAASSKDAAGAVSNSGKKIDNEWRGFGKKLTGPIIEAMSSGGDVMKAFKEGARNLFQAVQTKLADRVFKPLEDMIDTTLDQLFGSEEKEGKGTQVSPMITKEWKDTTIGKALGGEDGIGGMFSGLTDWFKGLWSGFKDLLGIEKTTDELDSSR